MSSGTWVLPCGQTETDRHRQAGRQTDRQTDMTNLTVGMFLPDYTDSRHGQKFKPTSGGFFIFILLNLKQAGYLLQIRYLNTDLACSSKY